MGGLGSGGHNKTHDQIEKRRLFRVDSFAIHDILNHDKYICYKSKVDIHGGCTIIRYNTRSRTAEIQENGVYYPLELSVVKNIDGDSWRLYFLCPCCGQRIRYLYRNYENGRYICRKCAKLNYRSQQVSGMAEMQLKMERIVEKLGDVTWYWDYDCIADVTPPSKPPYMRWKEYSNLVIKLRKLQADYYNIIESNLLSTCLGKKFCERYTQKDSE